VRPCHYGGNSLTACVFGVGDRVPNDVFKEDLLQSAPDLLVDQTGDTLHTPTTCQPTAADLVTLAKRFRPSDHRVEYLYEQLAALNPRYRLALPLQSGVELSSYSQATSNPGEQQLPLFVHQLPGFPTAEGSRPLF